MRDMDNMNKKDMYIIPLIFYSNEREEEIPEIINNNDDEEEILDRTVYIYIYYLIGLSNSPISCKTIL